MHLARQLIADEISAVTAVEIAEACSGEFLFRRVDRSQPKGTGKPLDVFELLGALEGPEELRATPEMLHLVVDWDRVYQVVR